MKRSIKHFLIIMLILVLGGVCTAGTFVAQARTIINNPPYYDQNLGCYVQVTTETYTEYDQSLKLNRNMKKTTTVYYKYENDTYVFISQNETEEILSYEPAVSASPSGSAGPSASVYPYPTSSAWPSGSPRPSVSPKASPSAVPTATPIPIDDDPPELTVTRKSGTTAKIKWEPVDNADGYIIYRSTKENKNYSKIKKVKDSLKVSFTDSGLKSSTTYYYKIKGYQKTSYGNRYTDISEPKQLTTIAVKKLVAKLRKLRAQYPDGKFWNHTGYTVSKGQSVEGFVTNHPCNHNGKIIVNGKTLENISSTCNYYRYTVDGKAVMGYQCAGFAAMINDKLFGKSAFRSHNSFSKAKVGDCVRYQNQHSAVIIEKHSNYVIVAECNYGNTCRIKWGRKILKSNLSGAVYYTKRAA